MGYHVGLDAAPVQEHPGPHDLRVGAFVAGGAQEGVGGEGAFGVSGEKDCLDLEGVEEAADVVGVGVADDDAVEVSHAPVAQEVGDVRTLLRPARVDQVALAPSLHEHAVALADIYKAQREGPGRGRVGPAGRGEAPAGRRRQYQDEQGDEEVPAKRFTGNASTAYPRRSLWFLDGARRYLPASLGIGSVYVALRNLL